MNVNSQNQAIEVPLERQRHGSKSSSVTDVESQQQPQGVQSTPTTDSQSSNSSSADSADQLVGANGASANHTTFIQQAPPTFKETAICVIFCIIGTLLGAVSLFFMEAHQRPMPVQYLESSKEYVRNLTNNEIYKGETVDTVGLMLLCVFIPGAIQATYGFARGEKGDFYRTICTYTVAFTITGIVTEFIKNYVGYLRPIYFDQCDPDDQYQSCSDEGWTINELSKSFVSGHASFAFCGGVLFTLFLERTIGISSIQVAIAQPQHQEGILPMTISQQQQQQQSASLVSLAYRQPPGWRKVGSIFAMSPMIISIWVACSRVVDNVHFPADVVGGAVLGSAIAAYCHPLWYQDPRYIA